MRYESSKGSLQILATVLFLVGLALTAVIDDTPAIGIAFIVVGLLLSITLLFRPSRNKL